MAVTLDRSSTHAEAIFRGQSETSQSLNPLTNNSCHKEPVTLPLEEKCFEAAVERRASSLQPAQRWVQQQSSKHIGGNSIFQKKTCPWTLHPTIEIFPQLMGTIIYKDFPGRCSIEKKCWAGQHVLAPWFQIELKLKIIHQNTEQMGRRNEKVLPFRVSRNTYSVCLTLSSYHNTPSRSNFKHSCKHRLVSHLWICVGKCHPFLFRLGVDQLPPDGCFFRGHASQLLSRWSAWRDEKQTCWLSEGETHCKDQTSGEQCAAMIRPGGLGRPIKTDISYWAASRLP